jgi:hypothetical protein
VWVLRLPVALWSIAGLALIYAFHRRLHGNRMEAVLVALLGASLPLALAYARCGWVPSFMPLASALVWYPAQFLARGRANRALVVTLCSGALLCLAVHLTSGVFLLAVALALTWTRREDVSARVARVLRVRASSWLLPALVAAIALVAGGAFLAFCSAANLSLAHVGGALARTLEHLEHPEGSAAYLALIGQFLSGARAYRYFAGVEPSSAMLVESLAFLALLIFAIVRVARSPDHADRFTAVFWMLVPFLLLATRGLLSIDFIGQERYVLWVLVAAPSVIVRGLDFAPRAGAATARAFAIAALCALLSVQCWQQYFASLRDASHVARPLLHRTLRTGEEEPKLAAARTIAALAASTSDATRMRVLAEDYWVQYPVQFLLGQRWTVQLQLQQAALLAPSSWFAVGFSGSEWCANLRQRLDAARVPFDEIEIFADQGPRILTLFHMRPRNEREPPMRDH